MKEQQTSIKVAVRIRPLLSKEGNQNVTSVIEQQLSIGEKAFNFDHLFDINSTQSSIYGTCVRSLVEGIFDGYNSTVLAYGQTGSGKTHTMGIGMNSTGNLSEEDLGIVPRAVQHIFDEIETKNQQAKNLSPVFEISVSFVELYNENIYDLLTGNRPKVEIRQNHSKEFFLPDAKEVPVKSPESLMQALRYGIKNRTVATTLMNGQSSRSHAVLTIHLKQRLSSSLADAAVVSTAKLRFVDLAGSERIAKTGATGARAQEGCSINKGLLILGNAIKALADKKPVEYRSSKLTQLLKDSLGGNSKTLMIACVSPSKQNLAETLSTLQYANRTKDIKTKVIANIDPYGSRIAELFKRIADLEEEINKSDDRAADLEKQRNESDARAADLLKRNADLEEKGKEADARVACLLREIDELKKSLESKSTNKVVAEAAVNTDADGNVSICDHKKPFVKFKFGLKAHGAALKMLWKELKWSFRNIFV